MISDEQGRPSHYVVLAGSSLLAVVPMLPILYQSFLDSPLYAPDRSLTTANYRMLLSDPALLGVLRDTLVFALGATFVALLVGMYAALVVGKVGVPFRKTLDEAQLWPLYISPLILAFGWIIAYGPSGYAAAFLSRHMDISLPSLYNLTGMVVIGGVALAPMAYLYISSSVSGSTAHLEDAARSLGAGPGRVLALILAPLLKAPVTYGAIILLAISLEMLSIPLVIGQPAGIDLISNYLFEKALKSPRPNYGLLAAMSIVLLVALLMLISLQLRLLGSTQKLVTMGGKATAPRDLGVGPWMRYALFLPLGAYTVVAIGIPLLAIIARSGVSILTPLVPIPKAATWDNFSAIASNLVYRRAVVNSLSLATIGAAFGTLVVAVLVLVAHRSQFRWRGVLDRLVLSMRAIPGVVMGLGFFWLVLALGIGEVRASLTFMGVVFLARFLPTAYAAVAPMSMRVSLELDAAGRSAGAGWWRTMFLLILPSLRPALFASYVLLFLHFLKEYVSAVFIYTPGNEVIGVVMLSAWAQGDVGPVAALVVIQLVFSVGLVYGARSLLGVQINA